MLGMLGSPAPCQWGRACSHVGHVAACCGRPSPAGSHLATCPHPHIVLPWRHPRGVTAVHAHLPSCATRCGPPSRQRPQASHKPRTLLKRCCASAPCGALTHGPTTSRASSLVAPQAHKHAYTVPPGENRAACTLSPALCMAVAQRRAEPRCNPFVWSHVCRAMMPAASTLLALMLHCAAVCTHAPLRLRCVHRTGSIHPKPNICCGSRLVLTESNEPNIPPKPTYVMLCYVGTGFVGFAKRGSYGTRYYTAVGV